MKVIIDVADNILYKSYYVMALYKLFGAENICFQNAPFVNLSKHARNSWSMNFIVEGENKNVTKYTIACNDSYKVNEELYDWCDVYGSVNANRELTEQRFRGKLVSLCPSFAVKCWNMPSLIYHGVSNLLKYHSGNPKRFLGKYKRLALERCSYETYQEEFEERKNYIYFCSTLWYNDQWNKNDEKVNAIRANFVRACKNVDGIEFEGGLVSQGAERSSEDLFRDCLTRHYSHREWIEKTKQSVLVFNTPAFWDCHGWKLGEYLSMGKAIISTKLCNDLPVALKHGENIHFVENNSVEALMEAVEYVAKNEDYRMHLELGACEYWKNYGDPIASLKLLGLGI